MLLLIWAPGWSRPGGLSAQRPFQPCHKRVGPGSSHGQAVLAAFPSPGTERTVFTPLGHIPTALGWVPTCSQVKKGLGRGRGGRGCGPEPQHLTEAGPDPPALLTLRGPAFMALCPPHGVGPWHQVFLVGLTSVTCGAAGCEEGGLRRTRQRRRAGGPELSRRRPGWETETKPARAGSREVHRDTRRAQEDGPCAQGTCVKLRGCPLCSGNLCPTS